MPQSCLLPLLGLVASAQRADDRHHHETAWDHVDRACTVVIDARKVTLRRTGDAAGPRLCAAELGGEAPRAGAAAVVVAWSQGAGRGARARLLNAAAYCQRTRRALYVVVPPAADAPTGPCARAAAAAAGLGALLRGADAPAAALALADGAYLAGAVAPEAYLEAAGADVDVVLAAAPRGEPPAAVVARRGARAAHALAAFRRGRCDAAAGLGPHARVLAPAPVGGLPALAGGGAAALVRTGGDPCADGACAPFAAEPAGGVASRALAWLRACSWGALFWLLVGACCGVPWVGYCVLFAYHFARFSAQPRAPAADRPKSLSVASTLEAIFT